MSASTLLGQSTGPVPVGVQPDPLTTTIPDALGQPHAECVSHRLAAVMRRGTVNSAITCVSHQTRESARTAALKLLRDDRVLRAMIVVDAMPPRFCEWVER